MKRRFGLLAFFALFGVSVATPPASAQFYGGYYGGFGPYFGPRVGPFFGPGLWGYGFPFYPGAVGNFWSNGNTLYGPPVATGGPVIGSFGGSDAVYNRSVGVHGAARDFNPVVPPANYTGPRFATRDVKRRYDEERRNPQIAIDRAYRDLYRGSPWPTYRR